MQKQFLLILFVFLTFCVNNIYSQSFDDTGFNISASKSNVLYRGLENPVDIFVAGYNKETIIVSFSNDEVTIKPEQSGYLVTVPTTVTEQKLTISISVKTSAGNQTIGSKVFNVSNVPPPTIMIAGTYQDGATMPKAAVLNNAYLTATSTGDFPLKVKYLVNKFDFIYRSGDNVTNITVLGNQITDNILSIIREMKQDDVLSFSNIFYDGPSGTKQTNGISVILK